MSAATPPAVSARKCSEPTAFAALTAAVQDTRGLLSGSGGRRRWRAFCALAVMAGLVGAGAAPPPLGLLVPLWSEPEIAASLELPGWLVPLGIGLGLFFLFMAGVARAFSLAFVEGIRSGQPQVPGYRRHLRRGWAHFAWSSTLTVPLYALLFGGEALVTHGAYAQLLRAAEMTDREIVSLLVAVALQFLLVLIPWTVLTLPAMVLMYELTPAAMLEHDAGPARACGLVLRQAAKAPGRFAGYFGVRFLLQLLGNTAAFAALIPSVLIAGLLSAPVTLGGWALSQALGGTETSGGAAAASVAVLVALVALYCVLCCALVPVAVLLNAFAVRFVGEGSGFRVRGSEAGLQGSEDCVRASEPGKLPNPPSGDS
jgi:hypothetical protein